MFKINQNIKHKFDCFLNTLLLILIILFNRETIVYGANNNWIEVSKTPAGIQYLEGGSLINKGKGIIEIKTKYLKNDPESLKGIEENIYAMRINCLTNEFKDISVNGKKILTAK